MANIYGKVCFMILSYSNLVDVKNNNLNKKIVFCSGSFDLLHVGHVLFLEDCKKLGGILVCAVGKDEALRIKGEDRPILNESVRIKMIDSLKVVDYCFLHKNITTPFLNSYIEEVLQLLKPDVWVVNEDATEIPFRSELAKKYGVTFYVLKRDCPAEFDQISTTKIIKKIKGE